MSGGPLSLIPVTGGVNRAASTAASADGVGLDEAEGKGGCPLALVVVQGQVGAVRSVCHARPGMLALSGRVSRGGHSLAARPFGAKGR